MAKKRLTQPWWQCRWDGCGHRRCRLAGVPITLVISVHNAAQKMEPYCSHHMQRRESPAERRRRLDPGPVSR